MRGMIPTVSPLQVGVHGRFEEEELDYCRKRILSKLIWTEWTPFGRLKNILESSQASMRGPSRNTTWFQEDAGNGLKIV